MRFMTTLTRLVVGMSRLGDHLLKRKASGIIVAALAFACGAGLAYGLKAGRRPPKRAAPTSAAAAPANCPPAAVYSAPPTTADEYGWGDSAELQEWKNRHSGTPLPLDYGPDWNKFEEPKVVVLRSGRMLAATGEALYMLDEKKRVVWEYPVTQWVVDFAYAEATGLVYLTAGDNNLFILDGATGQVLHANGRNGSAGYGAVIPYGDDACIVMDAFAGYRAGHAVSDPTPDGATAWRGTRMLWHVDVPPDARLQVAGSRVYAVTKTKTRLLVRELKVPKR
jgi:outer membrane protein assembly factor BamB